MEFDLTRHDREHRHAPCEVSPVKPNPNRSRLLLSGGKSHLRGFRRIVEAAPLRAIRNRFLEETRNSTLRVDLQPKYSAGCLV